MGQPSLPILSRLGIHMYWDNSWVNTFSNKIYFNKTLYIVDIVYYLLIDKVIEFYFERKKSDLKKYVLYFKEFILPKKIFKKTQTPVWAKKQQKQQKQQKQRNMWKFKKLKIKKHNITRVWFIKYNSFILLSCFVFFYPRTRKKIFKGYTKTKSSPGSIRFFQRRGRRRYKTKSFYRAFKRGILF